MQKEIYKSGKITGEVRLLKGRYVIPEGSTLDQLGITDGDTINILIEPDECVEIEVKCGPKTYKLEISQSMRVEELKQLLIKNNQVAFLSKDFHIAKLVIKDGASSEITMNDESLPLHFYGIQNESTLTVVRPFVLLNIVNIVNEIYFKQLPRDISVKQLKKTMIYAKRFYEHFDFYNIIMFTKTAENSYKKLDENLDVTIGDLFSDGDMIYLTMDNFFVYSYPLYYDGKEIGKVGIGYQESCLSVKLRTQEQTGIPVGNITISSSPPTSNNPRDSYSCSIEVKFNGRNKNYIVIV